MTTISPSVPAQAAIAEYLQHGGYDRHLRSLRHALESQQASMLASAARHFPPPPPLLPLSPPLRLALAQGIAWRRADTRAFVIRTA